ncbi:MAG: DUF4124 domain-containing protein [Pseudomonadales bacterium]|jgi:hypothetical protein
MQSSITKLATAMLFYCIANTAMASAEYYTWVDENGVTNYSQEPPNGIETTRYSREQRFGILQADEPEVGTPAPFNPGSYADEMSDYETPAERRADMEVDAAVAQLTASRKANCDRARKNLSNYKNRGRVRVIDADGDGEYRILSVEERQSKIDLYIGQIDENCGAY